MRCVVIAIEMASSSNLTLEDCDELRKIQAATDAQRNPPPVPAEIVSKLRAYGLVAVLDRGPTITDRGRGVLLEQDMRDAEDR